MRTPLWTTVTLCLLALLSAADVLSEGRMQWRGGGGWGPHGPYGRVYDAATVETVRGKVVAVDQMTPRKGMGPGVHLTLETGAGTISVHLGPTWYLERQDVAIAPNDEIEVKGSRVTFDGKPALIAAEVHKGGQTLLLRDASGIPYWAGWRRTRPGP
jgi:hypothetical protein